LLPGRDSPIGSPRGAQKIGLIKSDHPRILQQLKCLAKD
jgi:hypothetical protein